MERTRGETKRALLDGAKKAKRRKGTVIGVRRCDLIFALSPGADDDEPKYDDLNADGDLDPKDDEPDGQVAKPDDAGDVNLKSQVEFEPFDGGSA